MVRNRVSCVCLFCGKDVDVIPSRVKTFRYCSKDCYNKASNTDLNVLRISRPQVCCVVCGKSFTITNNMYRHKKTCSNECLKKMMSSITCGRGSKEKHNVKCRNCENVFLVHEYRKGRAKFCSVKCHDQFRQDRHDVTCVGCGCSFTVTKSGDGRCYCFIECARKGSKRSRSRLQVFVEACIKARGFYYVPEFSSITAKTKLFYDLYIPDLNMIIECQGTFWHRDPRFYAEDYTAHNKTSGEIWKHDELKRQIAVATIPNVTYITIWEEDCKRISYDVSKFEEVLCLPKLKM